MHGHVFSLVYKKSGKLLVALPRSLLKTGLRKEPSLSHQRSVGPWEAGHLLAQVVEEFPWTEAGKYRAFCHAERHRRMKTATAIAALSSLMALSFSLKKAKASGDNLIEQSTFESKNWGAGDEWLDVCVFWELNIFASSHSLQHFVYN